VGVLSGGEVQLRSPVSKRFQIKEIASTKSSCAHSHNAGISYARCYSQAHLLLAAASHCEVNFMINLNAFREQSDCLVGELRGEVAEIRSTQSLLAQFRQLMADCADAELGAAKSKLFDELCESYEKIAIPKGDYGRVTVTIDSEFEASLCNSIDELLDQLACLRASSRLWDVKAALACTQIGDFASRRQVRLEKVLRSNVPPLKSKVSPRFAPPRHVAGSHQVSA